MSLSGLSESNFTCSSDPTDSVLTPRGSATGRCTARSIARSGPGRGCAPGLGAADRRVTDVAPAVAMTNRRAAVFVSKPVGYVQHHPQCFTLLAQMWVR
jgi:hypothetical protein